MRYLLAAAAACLCLSAQADLITKQGSDEIRLADSACVHGETLSRIEAQHRSRFKKLDARIGGQRYYGCYVVVEDWVLMIFEDGDVGRLPLSAFKETGV